MNTKIGLGIDLNDISDEFDVQGHRSKVTITKNVISRSFSFVARDNIHSPINM